jgi:hypothetical protein
LRKPEGYLFHVGADTTDKETVGISNPRIGSTFELLPIVEIDKRSSQEATFGSLFCRNTDKKCKVSRYLPKEFDLDATPHLDPDLDNFTYGEPMVHETKNGKTRANGKAGALRCLKRRDYVFFAASLGPFPVGPEEHSRSSILECQSHDRGKYIVGYFQLKGIFGVRTRQGKVSNTSSIDNSNLEDCIHQLRENAHYKRYSEHFVCGVGFKRMGGVLIKSPMRITEPRSYKLNPLGLDLVRREYSGETYYRGARHLDDIAVKRLLDELRNTS